MKKENGWKIIAMLHSLKCTERVWLGTRLWKHVGFSLRKVVTMSGN